MGAALVGVDRVGEGVDALAVRLVPLHGDLDGDARALRAEADHRPVGRTLARVEVPDEVLDAALVVVGDLDRDRLALVADDDGQAAVEEGHLLQPAGDGLEGVRRRLEDARVGPERDRRAVRLGRLALAQRGGRRRVGVALVPRETVALDLDVQPGGQGVHDADPDAVQAAGHGVGLAVELAARVQRGQHHLDRRPLLHRVPVDRDAAAVVLDPDPAVGQQRHPDRVADPGQRLVDGVVDHLLDEVVQAALPGRADVHARPLAYGLEPLEYLDLPSVVARLDFRC